MECRDVTEFIVVPPDGRRSEVWAAKESFANYLGRRFPGYSFRIARVAPIDIGDAFGVYPVMNFIGPDNRSFMCNEPPSWLLQEIRRACNAFDKWKYLAA